MTEPTAPAPMPGLGPDDVAEAVKQLGSRCSPNGSFYIGSPKALIAEIRVVEATLPALLASLDASAAENVKLQHKVSAWEKVGDELAAERDAALSKADKLTGVMADVLRHERNASHSDRDVQYDAEAWQRDAEMYKQRADASAARVVELEAALKPFARLAVLCGSSYDDMAVRCALDPLPQDPVLLIVGHLRTAARALSAPDGDRPEQEKTA